jgi:phosphoribosylformylglycinamidine synthase
LQGVGFSTTVLPVSAVDAGCLEGVSLVVFSGGFSYGDYVMSGRFAELETKRRLGDRLREWVEKGGYVLGICNGFQILARLGLLPEGTLIDNTSHRFQCRWVSLENRAPDSPWLRGLPACFELPIAHAEGRFVAPEGKAEAYRDGGLAALTYVGDVNGSSAGIAGLQDASGHVFGLMPHPERFYFRRHHYDPDWDGHPEWGWGRLIFQSIYQTITSTTKP